MTTEELIRAANRKSAIAIWIGSLTLVANAAFLIWNLWRAGIL